MNADETIKTTITIIINCVQVQSRAAVVRDGGPIYHQAVPGLRFPPGGRGGEPGVEFDARSGVFEQGEERWFSS